MKVPKDSLAKVSLALWCIAIVCGVGVTADAIHADGPAAKRAAAEKLLDKQYDAWVSTLPPRQQDWERVLQENLGSYYLPLHKRDKVAGRSNAWDFVQDDPHLPRVLLIGDSVSRGYTLSTRKALSGKANVHRAPANCGPTSRGLKKLDVWLSDGKWDVIYFNFGIHDRNTPVADYSKRLEQLVERLEKTGAKLVWASTTPIPDSPAKKLTAASIIERNDAAAVIMRKHGVAIDDLFTAIAPHLEAMQIPGDVHFNAAGYEFLGQRVAEAISSVASVRAAAPAERPNFLWLTAEDMSPNLGCYDDPDAVTPNLDRLAARGVRYTQAFAPAGVCAPARSCLIMGMYASSIGSHHMRSIATLPQSVRPFTTYLRQAGYFCTNQSKQDYNFKTPPDAWDIGRGSKAHWRSRRPDQPFFAVFNYMDTHESRIRGPTTAKVPLTEAEHHDPDRIHLPPYLPDTPLIRHDWARELDLITMIDKAWIPRLLGQLEEDGLADDTIVFFFGDHGVGLPRSKQFVYDSGMQVPLIIYFPPKWRHLAPAGPGSTVDRLVSFVDFGPSVLSLAGVPIPKHMQGKPFLGEQATAPRKYVYGIRDRMDERYDMTRTVRDNHFKYHRHYMPYLPHFPWLDYMEMLNTSKELRRLKAEGKLTDGPAFFMADTKPIEELYDIRRDPYELHNLVGDPAYRDELERLRHVHQQWVLETVDTGLIPEQELRDRAADSSEYEYARSGRYDVERIAETAWLMDQGEQARDELVRRLDDPDAAVRFWAANGLTNLGWGDHSAQTALKNRLDDACPEVRGAAAQALCRAGRVDQGLPVLVRLLDDDSLWVRLAAADAIDYLGEQARPAAAALQKAAADQSRGNRYIRRVVDHTLRQLGVAPR